MGRTNFATLMLYAALASALLGYSGGAPLQQPTPRLIPKPFPLPPPLPPQPLCAPQFALVNQACSMIVPMPVPPPASPPGPLPPPPCPNEESQHGHRHHHRHNCNGHQRGHGHGHGHHHRHRHDRHWGEPSPAEQDCCNWLKEVDSECVCDLLDHLPTFLARPIHDYTVIVGDSCNVTYACGGRLHP